MSTRKSTPKKKKAAPAPPMTLELRDDGVAVVTIDVPGEKQNTLKEDFAPVFEEILAEIDASDARAVIVTSGKESGFLAGADITMLRGRDDAAEVQALSERGQAAFNRLSGLRIPTVAAIHGPCLGGGLELALACTARVISDDPKTVLGLPEVQLGLLPGAGGTQRLPRLIGIAAALDLLLTGKQVRARKARSLGLVDEAVPAANLMRAATAQALRLAEHADEHVHPLNRLGEFFREVASADGARDLVLEDNALGRHILFQQARKQLLAKTRGNYPAPERILDAVEVGIEQGFEDGLKVEARFFGELAVSPEAEQLMGIFFATQELKKGSGIGRKKINPNPIHQVGILGAGLMGAGIAMVTLDKADTPVRLKDRDHDGLGRGLASIHKYFDKRRKRRILSKAEAARQLHRVTGTTDYSGFSRCDLVIEAVFEDLALKHQILRDVEANTPDTTIFGSNTSSIPITTIAEASSRPQNVIGLHYFSPVEKMPLLEIIRTKDTAEKVVATCVDFGRRQGKTVIVVGDGVGFYTSRILSPYMNEAARILAEGASVEAVDGALTRYGFPVGPITLLDEVGIDVGEKVGRIMIDAFGDRMEPPAIMVRLVEDDRKGRKNGRGFYTYDGKDKTVDPSVYALLGTDGDRNPDPTDIAERCTLLMVNEAVRCLEEKILQNPRDGDIGAIFGLGFPPFRGGPFRFIDAMGADRVVARLEGFAAEHGDRFAPAELLLQHAASAKPFHKD